MFKIFIYSNYTQISDARVKCCKAYQFTKRTTIFGKLSQNIFPNFYKNYGSIIIQFTHKLEAEATVFLITAVNQQSQ